MKFWKKWSYLIILLVCGGFILTGTGSWASAGEPARRAGGWLLAVGSKAVAGVQEYMGADISADNEEANKEPSVNVGADKEQIVNAEHDASGDNTAADAENADSTGSHPQPEATEEQPEITRRDPSEVVYTAVEDDYFSDAVFIGDSRTVGLFEYGGLENVTTFYASTGLTIFKLFEAQIVEVPGQKEKITVEQALQERQFSKIYLMVGINEMGRGDLEGFLTKYGEVVAHLRELQPNAVIYLQGIMKVTTKRSEQGDYIHNTGIEERNTGIAALADNVKVYYLDVNPLICDETGGMEPSYTTDGVHLKAQYIPMWKDFIKEHAVVLD